MLPTRRPGRDVTRPQIVVRLGAGLALRWDRQHAWRAVVVSVAVFLSSFCLLVTLACVKAASEAGDRTTARTPMVIDTSDRVADGLTMVERGPIWHGYQVPVVWLEPGESSTLVPPGLRKIPDPGTVAISPGLEAAGFRKDSLGLTVGDAGSGERGTIGLEGLGSASEFLVYARPAVGRQLGSDGVRYTIKSFGIPPGFSRSADPSREAFPWRLETDPPAPSPLREGLTVGLLIALPCFMLLWAAGGALSGTRDARLRALERLGIGRGGPSRDRRSGDRSLRCAGRSCRWADGLAVATKSCRPSRTWIDLRARHARRYWRRVPRGKCADSGGRRRVRSQDCASACPAPSRSKWSPHWDIGVTRSAGSPHGRSDRPGAVAVLVVATNAGNRNGRRRRGAPVLDTVDRSHSGAGAPSEGSVLVARYTTSCCQSGWPVTTCGCGRAPDLHARRCNRDPGKDDGTGCRRERRHPGCALDLARCPTERRNQTDLGGWIRPSARDTFGARRTHRECGGQR